MLALQLCRFNTRMHNDNGPVTLQEELHVSGGHCYTLRAVVVHRGSTIATGHYVAFTRPSNGGPWLLHNDAWDTTRPHGPTAQVVRAAYLCFCVRTT